MNPSPSRQPERPADKAAGMSGKKFLLLIGLPVVVGSALVFFFVTPW